MAKQLAEQIRAVGKTAKSEEDVRLNVELALRHHLTQLGIQTQPSYEQPVTTLKGTGSTDAVYGFGIIEYKRPGIIGTPRGRKELVEQLSGYLVGKAREEAPTKPHEAVKKMIGIGLDGEQVMYLRYSSSPNRARFFQPVSLETQLEFFKQKGLSRGGFQVVGPMPINEASVDWLLYSLQFFHRRALEPHALAEVFGPKADLASKAINAFYQKLLAADNPRVEMFFAQWDMIFGVIYGQELERGDAAAKELAELYGIDGKPDLKRLLFAVHTYYVLLMKMLAAELVSLQEGSWFASFTAEVEAASDAELKTKVQHLEDGGLFKQFNIVNFLEGDFFRWYLDVWETGIAQNFRHMAIAMQQFEPATATIDPDATRDLLKKLYQYLLPRPVRHALGEYYTPDWLAERLIRQTGYDGNPNTRVLDPSCGSGTFLALCIRKAFDYADKNLIRPDELVQKLLTNIVGFDLNPLAVIAARTNFLLSLGTLIRHAGRIEIPVYFCDSIITPSEFAQERDLSEMMGYMPDRYVDTIEGRFTFPAAVVDKEKIESVCAVIEESVQLGRNEKQFVEKLHAATPGLDEYAEGILKKVFVRIAKLNIDGRNGIWARFLKNQFAPVFVGKKSFDFVIGNPPWVNWQSLSDSYRAKTWKLWENYGLFSLSGHAARLGGGKKDLAMLFTYACLDEYVKDGGRLGFIITQTLFKTKGAGDGFRRFQLGDREHFKVFQVDDLSDFQPFEGATNRTAIVTFQKGRATKYPVPYLFWQKKDKQSIGLDDELEEVLAKITVKQWLAQPINSEEPNSPWISARPKALDALRRVIGQSAYRAYAGSFTGGLNGVFWIEIPSQPERNDRLLLIRNLYDIGKTKVKQVECALETDLIHPLLRGRDVGKWSANASCHIILAQDPVKRIGIDEEWMKQNLPKTFEYLKGFENDLKTKRQSGVVRDLMKRGAFYSMFAIGEYTLAPFKVCWREQAEFFTASVAGKSGVADQSKVIIPDHKLMFVPFNNETEAHFVCAAINSSPGVLVVKSYGIETQTSTHVLENVSLPKFDANDNLHQHLAQLSKDAHTVAAESEPDTKRLEAVETEIDAAAAELWSITPAELADIKFSLADLR